MSAKTTNVRGESVSPQSPFEIEDVRLLNISSVQPPSLIHGRVKVLSVCLNHFKLALTRLGQDSQTKQTVRSHLNSATCPFHCRQTRCAFTTSSLLSSGKLQSNSLLVGPQNPLKKDETEEVSVNPAAAKGISTDVATATVLSAAAGIFIMKGRQ